MDRVLPDGNHLRLGDRPYRVKGVTYGSFAPRSDGALFPEPVQVKNDFVAITDAGFNTVRTYATPPDDVLDTAGELGLRLLVGTHYKDWRYLPRPGRSTDRTVLDAGRRAVAEAVERCAAAPHVIAISVGNEVPADVARVHGIGRVEHVLGQLVDEVHRGAPGVLATYSNFPTTEFLDVPGQDLVSFNVFLEDPEALRRYLTRIQLRAGDRPLLVTELGLASGAHSPARQAESIREQLRVVDEVGVAGATIFAWTDEWDVAGYSQADWGFGLTTAEREPKPALAVAEEWTARSIADLRDSWPKVSVIVCAFNEGRRMQGCMESLARCTYPNLEVVVCDDGSTDDTLTIARAFPFRVLQLDHGGLSRARNAGIAAATGDIIAFLDADAECHPEWPFHIAMSIERGREAGVVAAGGPNLPFAQAPLTEHAVSSSPGNPRAVLVSDDRAEHIAGCNCAFTAEAIREINGFNPAYTSAGDDVDVCWRLLDRGYSIGYSTAAQVTHHRRDSVKGFLKQQRGYGRAEKMLSGSHAHRFNRLGQATWSGAIYGSLRPLPRLLRPVVYHGYAGFEPYQAVRSQPAETMLSWMGALVPLAIPAAAAGIVLALFSPWFLALTVLALVGVLVLGVLAASAGRPPAGVGHRARFRFLVGLLHVAQPFARLWGRLRAEPVVVAPDASPEWWGDRATWLHSMARDLRGRGCAVHYGGENDGWDIEARVGPFVRARVVTAVTWNWVPHWRVRLRPRWGAVAMTGLGVAGLLAVDAVELAAAVIVGAVIALVGERILLSPRVERALAETAPVPEDAAAGLGGAT